MGIVERKAIVDGYYGKNNSIPVLDSLLINELTVKSGEGYPLVDEPKVGDRYSTVNNSGMVVSVSGKSVGIRKDSGYPNLNTRTADAIDVNSDRAMNVGRYSYREGEMGVESKLQNSLALYDAKFV